MGSDSKEMSVFEICKPKRGVSNNYKIWKIISTAINQQILVKMV
jgi:hypothetical protein